MSLFEPVLASVETSVNQYSWTGQIQEFYYKTPCAHNSISNPNHPKNKKNVSPNTNVKKIISPKYKFTIFGDRVTKEFIYCINLVKDLHKYRKKNFESPVIRGVTTVEWPSVWDDLKVKFGGIAFCLRSSVAVLLNGELIGGEKELKEFVETKYSYHLCLNYYKEAVAEFTKYVNNSGKPCAYMHIAIDGHHVGTLIFMLYADIVPNTCENFLRLCKKTRGGYSGTPVHRIVKDGWIQCGGFGLKSTDLNCENFIVPHDRRGVLSMANDGRDIDCSTQFFVLLQPAPWMANKYVAFGQLIEGKETLEKIEAIPTWYESPISPVIIYKAGIFNTDCQDFLSNKGTYKYIDGHIEDLNDVADQLYGVLLEKVFLTVQQKDLERLKELEGEEGAHDKNRLNKEVIKIHTKKSATVGEKPPTASAIENTEFDVESYEPEELEGTDYKHQSKDTSSLVVKPAKPYYIPLTDVLYPGEKDSDFNLRRFLQGEYCLESDLQYAKVMIPHQERFSYSSDIFELDDSEVGSDDSLDSDDEKEIQKYLKLNSDRVSFAGGVIKKIGKGVGKINLFSEARKSELITDDQLRRLRLASITRENSRDRKVSINVPSEKEHHKIKRRQTGFVHPEDLERIRTFQTSHLPDDQYDDEDDKEFNRYDRHVSMSVDVPDEKEQHQIKRRQTGFVRPEDLEKIRVFQKDISDDSDQERDERKVQIHPNTTDPHGPVARRPTGYVRPEDIEDLGYEDDEDKQKVRINPTTPESHGPTARRPTAFVRNGDVEEADDEDTKQKVYIDPATAESRGPIARRPTAFVRQTYTGECDDEDDEDNTQKVRIDPATADSRGPVARRPTAFVRPTADIEDEEDDDKQEVPLVPRTADPSAATANRSTASVRKTSDFEDFDDEKEVRPSVLLRLFEDVKGDKEPPTLKNYKPMSESKQKNILLFSTNYRIESDESTKEKYVRYSQILEKPLEEHILNLQYGKQAGRKISSDYVKTIDQMEHRLEKSLRSLEFAKTRPTLTVAEYQLKNRLFKEKLKLETYMKAAKDFDKELSGQSLPLPVSPTYSKFDIPIVKKPHHPSEHGPKQHRRHHHHVRHYK